MSFEKSKSVRLGFMVMRYNPHNPPTHTFAEFLARGPGDRYVWTVTQDEGTVFADEAVAGDWAHRLNASVIQL